MPVLIAMHGGGGNKEGFRDTVSLDAVADKNKFIVVYSEGTSISFNFQRNPYIE